ncbi:uncharacterized protein [Amphiura filiformis]|uniref:uncharacterized protein isoform X1 n=1 Tax=Amphiura filiformis TaxID=82378 RepID=UPI003B21BD3D
MSLSNVAVFTIIISVAAALVMTPVSKPTTSPPGLLTTEEKEAIIIEHNRGRSNVQPPASNMHRLFWDDTLEVLVQASVNACRYDLNLDDPIEQRGNLIQLTGITQTSDFSLSDAVNTWYSLASYYDYDTHDCTEELFCQVYKLVSWASGTSFACAQKYCPELYDTFNYKDKEDRIYWKCVYEDVGQFWESGVDPYITGVDPCTECASGSGWCNDDLCDYSCSPDDGACTCAFENPLGSCNGNGVLNSTACTCDCGEGYFGNHCLPEACGFVCGHNAIINETNCTCQCAQPGYELEESGLSCRDINECLLETDLCEHLCINTDGSYDCECQNEYELQPDGYSCAFLEFQFSKVTVPLLTPETTSLPPSESTSLPSSATATAATTLPQNMATQTVLSMTTISVSVPATFQTTSASPRAIRKKIGNKLFRQVGIQDETTCNHNLTEPGTISSPYYPDDYPYDADCQYNLTAPTGFNVELVIQDLEIETPEWVYAVYSSNIPAGCPWDYLSVYDGPEADESRLIDVFCGSMIDVLEPVIRSSGQYIYLEFKSDESGNYRGFQANFTFLDIDDCSPNPCQNEGNCTDGVDSYTCTCAAGYTGTICDTNIDDCNPNPCQNGGSCSDGVDSYTCTCAAGYTGTTCDTNIDDCSPNPCQNEGNCTDGVDSYTCTCAAGYTGTICDTNINDCNPNPCHNESNCTDGVDSYTCTCAAGYTGTICDTNIDDCTPNPCQNEGNCTDGVDSYTCTCTAGYTGTICDTNIDDCTPSPCQNEGNCTDGVDSYTCTCTAGYTGTICDTNIDDCTPNPCQNEGNCTDGVDSYTCTCTAGYTGTICDTNIDDCTPSPCQNEGNCTDGVDSYTCTCAAGYTGTICDRPTNINDCNPNPCQNEGSCTDGVDSYTCTCAAGYTGTICDTNINDCSQNPCQNGGSCTDGVDSYTCTCTAGYTGTICDRPTNPSLYNSTDFWDPPPIFGDRATCCPRSCYACGCDSSIVCHNDGTLAKIEGESWQVGICRCFCKFPWSGATCDECNLECENGGTLDESSCQCLCSGWTGYNCADPCVQTSRLCNSDAARDHCDDPAIYKYCPRLCGRCGGAD